MIHRLALGALLLLACHHGAGGAGLAPCRLDPPSSGVTVPVDSLAGEYRLELISDSGGMVEGTLRLHPPDPSLPPRAGPYGLPDATHRYPLVGTAQIDLAAAHAVAPGGTTSSDAAAPGVLVIERVGGNPAGERLLLRLGALANQTEPVRFDGGYTVLRVRQADAAGFRGTWESGAPLPQAHGHFCASRTRRAVLNDQSGKRDILSRRSGSDGGAGNRTLVRVSVRNRVYVRRLGFLPSPRVGAEPTSPWPSS